MSVEKIERILVDMVCAGGDSETIRKRARQIAKIAAPVKMSLSSIVAQLQGVDLSPFPGLYDLIPWTELECAAACEDDPKRYLT